MFLLGVLFPDHTSAFDYFDKAKWPIAKKNLKHIKTEATTYYDIKGNRINEYLLEFNKEGFVTSIKDVNFNKVQSNKETRLYYKG